MATAVRQNRREHWTMACCEALTVRLAPVHCRLFDDSPAIVTCHHFISPTSQEPDTARVIHPDVLTYTGHHGTHQGHQTESVDDTLYKL